jgi:hypothetical protein
MEYVVWTEEDWTYRLMLALREKLLSGAAASVFAPWCFVVGLCLEAEGRLNVVVRLQGRQ